MNLRACYEAIKLEYPKVFPSANHPTKNSIILKRDEDDLVTSYFNTMSARLSSGVFGSKTIYVDEDRSVTSSRTLVFDKDGEQIANVDANELTNIRCGLMAALAFERYLGREPSPLDRVGFIGCGKINITTAWVFKELFGIWDFVIRGSDSLPDKNSHLFPGNVVVSSDHKAFQYCQAVIVSTNNSDPEKALSTSLLNPLNHSILYISQESGWTLDYSFRRDYASFCDHPFQETPWDQHGFPFDPPLSPAAHSPFLTFNELANFCDAEPVLKPAVVYLSGMAFTDIIMALHAKDQKEGNNQAWHTTMQSGAPVVAVGDWLRSFIEVRK